MPAVKTVLKNWKVHSQKEELNSGNTSVAYFPHPFFNPWIKQWSRTLNHSTDVTLCKIYWHYERFLKQFSIKDFFAFALDCGKIKQESLKKSWCEHWAEGMDKNVEVIENDKVVSEQVVLGCLPLENHMSQLNWKEWVFYIVKSCQNKFWQLKPSFKVLSTHQPPKTLILMNIMWMIQTTSV